MNIAFNYQYRDASNFKRSGQVIFENPDSWSLSAISLAFECTVIHGTFIADQIKIPELFSNVFMFGFKISPSKPLSLNKIFVAAPKTKMEI